MAVDATREAETFKRTLTRIIPGLILLGSLAYLAYLTLTTSGTAGFYQIGIAVGMLVYLMTFMDITLGIAVLIACIGLSPEVSLAGVSQLRLEDFVLPGLLLAWLTRAAQEREEFARVHVKAPLLCYFGAILLSTGIGLAEGTNDRVLALSIGLKYLEYFGIFLLLINNVRKEGEFRALVVVALLVALFSAATGTAGITGGAAGTRVQGPLGETSNIFGGYLALHFSILAGLFLHARTGPARALTGLGLVALLVALLYTYSRTTYIALTVALVAFGILKERRVLLILVLLAVALPLVTPAGILSRVVTIGGILSEEGPASFTARKLAWEMTLQSVVSKNPLFGFGLGSIALGWVDSEYFRTLSDTGFLGLCIFGWLLVQLLRTANRGYDALAERGFHKGFAAGYWIALIAMIVHATAATSFTSIRIMEAFIVFTGLFIAQVNRREEWNLAALPTPPSDGSSPVERSPAAAPSA